MEAGHIGSTELKELVAREAPVNIAFPVSDLPRLAALVPAGDVPAGDPSASGIEAGLDAQLRFEAGTEGFPRLHLTVSGAVPVVCQRCLAAMAWPVDVDVQLTMINRDEDAASLADPFDTVVLADGALSVVELVEDEVLAALPLAPRHPDVACAGQRREEPVLGGRTHRPMAGLADLLRREERRGEE